jgi:hypothetical protein
MTGQPEIRDAFGTQTMRVLIIGTSDAPEETGIAPCTIGLAEHLAARGNQATIVTGVPSYPRWQIYPDYHGVLRPRSCVMVSTSVA